MPSNIWILYFHANAEDIALSYNFVNNLREYLMVNVLIVEYPGYGVYTGSPCEETICEDALMVYECLVEEIGVERKNIIAMGRSIGSGPATYLASKREVGGLVIVSGYTSIRDVASDMVGEFVSGFLKERFPNKEHIKRVTSPVMIIHGKQDELISHAHAEELAKNCTSQVDLHLSEEMKHNSYSLMKDLIHPLLAFFGKHNFYKRMAYGHSLPIRVPDDFFRRPAMIEEDQIVTLAN